MKEMVGGCCVCSDERGWDENPLVYCDGQGCNVAVHQACYGIVSVPSGPWYCRKCESQERTARVHCELCPRRDGALKKTDTNGWAHVVCALYIPEVRFGNVTTMEPIQISLIPPDRFAKTCYICEENNQDQKKNLGACMTCNKAGCKQSFHVTCAQLLGLLCEEAGNLMDNVKYCGYCRNHYSKLKKTSNMKIIPPYKPVGSNLTESPGSSPEKNNQKGQTPAITQADGMSISSSSSTSSNNSSGGKKAGSGGIASNGKLNHVNQSSNSNQHSPVSRVPLQPSNLFSSGAFSASLGNGNSKTDDTSKPEKLKLKMHPEDNQSSNSKGSHDDSHGKPNGNFTLKNKDFSNLSMTDVVAATLDRPITSTGGSASSSKFDISSTTGGTESTPSHNNPNSNPGSGSGSSGSSRAIDKPPPDIKPHVTLTPIPPIRPSSSSAASADERERHDSRSSKSPAHHFPSSFGQSSSKSHSQISPDINRESNPRSADFDDKSPNKRSRVSGEFDSDTDSASETTWQERQNGDHLDAMQTANKGPQHLSRKERYILMGQQQDKQNQMNKGQNMEQWNREREQSQASKSPTVSLEKVRVQEGDNPPLKLFGSEFSPKRGPGRPVKRHSANSRDDDVRDRKAPTKARGRRGGGSTNSFSRRDVVNGGTPPDHEENSLDDIRDSGSSRGGRHSGPTRKSNPLPTSSGPPPKRPNYDEVPTPTLSQLKSQANANSEKVTNLAPHMFGNVLNTNSSMANRLVDTLSQEMEASGVSETTSPQTKLVGIPFPGKSPATNGSAIATNGNVTTPRAGTSTAPPQTLEELLERQWEQGSQFLMEQAEHLDIAQLLSCLNQLKQDNRALEDHVGSLIQRKEHLSAINARLQIPLTNSGTLGASYGNTSHSGGHGTPPVPSIPVSNKGLTGRGPSPHQQLQAQIQQEALMHQGRIPTHPFPGSESEKNAHGQSSNQMHNHMNSHGPRRDMQHSGGSGSGQHYYSPAGGHPVPVVISHPSSHQTHHPPIRRDRD